MMMLQTACFIRRPENQFRLNETSKFILPININYPFKFVCNQWGWFLNVYRCSQFHKTNESLYTHVGSIHCYNTVMMDGKKKF